MSIACCYDMNADTRSIWRNVTSQNAKERRCALISSINRCAIDGGSGPAAVVLTASGDRPFLLQLQAPCRAAANGRSGPIPDSCIAANGMSRWLDPNRFVTVRGFCAINTQVIV
jgi:hypothetical protein